MSDDRRPPDGGWGWMIVLAAFFLNLLNGGIFSIHGILYEEFLLTFPDLTKTSAAWLTSAQAGLCFISGKYRYSCGYSLVNLSPDNPCSR